MLTGIVNGQRRVVVLQDRTQATEEEEEMLRHLEEQGWQVTEWRVVIAARRLAVKVAAS